MTETLPPHLTADDGRFLSPRDEARVHLADRAHLLARKAMERMPVDPGAAPGALLRAALDLHRHLDAVLAAAVVAERERGTSWSELGAAEDISKQAAHEKWARTVRLWSGRGRIAADRDLAAGSTLERAAELDAAYAAARPGAPADAVSAGLDAVRHPAAVDAEHARRGQAAVLHERRRALLDQANDLYDRYQRLDPTAPADRPRIAANRAADADLCDQLAALYGELAAAEPALAEDHRAEQDRHRAHAAQARHYAALLTEQSGA
ncbi:hypothetical protein [Streptomyces silvensis]|uniref:Uncharacterized protein n=1 Tax=Streptomyces silvensis TaxID=1765722 RepID=A0A0W7X3H9_9ACTN|nr:hypothetical protein [Streptomyces silvensis]KUF17359.1 hypothetical protein AT728_16275 [Streptomyces silvensis]